MAPSFKVISFNTEGLSTPKIDLLSNLKADVLCLQETHKTSSPATIPGMCLAIYHASPIHGSAIYVRNRDLVKGCYDKSANGIEILQLETDKLTITSVYKPPPVPFVWPNQYVQSKKPQLIIGDFNSHNTDWGYDSTDKDGELVEEWALSLDLTILNKAKDEPSFLSARWKKGYNPDLAFVSSQLCHNFHKSTGQPIPKSQHRPIVVESRPVVQPIITKPKPRFNYRRADWDGFTRDLDNYIISIPTTASGYQSFVSSVWQAAKKNIPRGCREEYVAGLNNDSKAVYDQYIAAYNLDPFSTNTLELSESLMTSLNEARRDRWRETVSSIDMTHNSKMAWKTLNKLNAVNQPQKRMAGVTSNQVANQLLLNGKPLNNERGYLKKMKDEMNQVLQDSDDIFLPFTMTELKDAMKHLKTGKASGLDGISSELIINFGPRALNWLLALYNYCATDLQIPKIWRKAKVVALLKPKKDPNAATSYRPISLLCITYKLYERLILTRITPTVEDHLTADQSGFRAGKSCVGQVLNLTQYVEDGFQAGVVTGAVLIDLTAAYDTVNHRALLLKVGKIVKNAPTVRIIKSLLSNRRFYVEMEGKESRWRVLKNGLPQGSVLAPTLFNIYTNDLPTFHDIRRFIYADDLCLATQSNDFKTIEGRLTRALHQLSAYYKKWHLNPNPGKTKVCLFHLKNHLARKTLDITWEGKLLEFTEHPVYLGVTLDRTLSFKTHVDKLRKKLSPRNNLVASLANSSWGAGAQTLRLSALALCYSTAEYCAAVWGRSAHASKVDVQLNKVCRTITGNLKSTSVHSLYQLSGICPPAIRRETLSKSERDKQLSDDRHPLYGHQEVPQRLKSRKSFLTCTGLGQTTPASHRMKRWKESIGANNNKALPEPKERLPLGWNLLRKEWVTLNRARAKVAKTRDNLLKWGFVQDADCPCGAAVQTIAHILTDCPLSVTCSDTDLRDASSTARQLISRWSDTI